MNTGREQAENPELQDLADLPEFSVIVPVHNEMHNVGPLAAEIARALEGRAYEMIFVDDASGDDTRAELVRLKTRFPALRIITHQTNAGQSRAIRSGLLAARAPIVGLLDGDGQNDPADLPSLYRQLTRAAAPSGLRMVMGRRTRRQDTVWKRAASRLANHVRQRLLKDGCDDSGCGIKVVERTSFLNLPYFDHMHRYMPALMIAEGHQVEFMPVNHRPRATGTSNYTNLGRLVNALSDLQGVIWLIRRRRSPGGTREI